MDVRVFLPIGGRDGVDHRLRFLGRRPVVEIDKRLAVHLAWRGSGNRPGSHRYRNSLLNCPGIDDASRNKDGKGRDIEDETADKDPKARQRDVLKAMGLGRCRSWQARGW